jgi:hypothetical protein
VKELPVCVMLCLKLLPVGELWKIFDSGQGKGGFSKTSLGRRFKHAEVVEN